MSRRDIGTDDPRVRVRPGRGSRPRTKQRPSYDDAPLGRVLSVDRGRYRVVTADGTRVTAVKARELNRTRTAVVVGDEVRLAGDVSGEVDTLARMVAVEDRRTVLMRSAEDGDLAGVERPVVANAEQLAVVTALADPPPRPRMIDRILVAAYDAGMDPLLVLTKADLTPPGPLLELYAALEVPFVVVGGMGDRAGGPPAGVGTDGAGVGTDGAGVGTDGAGVGTDGAGVGAEGATTDATCVDARARDALAELKERLADRTTVLIGHSGVGKSTLVNALVPDADRATSHVNVVTGRGRHTSSSAVALPLPGGGWVVDTPGVRSFGLAHVSPDSLLDAFGDLAAVAEDCPRGCRHADDSPDCALDDHVAAEGPLAAARVESFRRLAAALAAGPGTSPG